MAKPLSKLRKKICTEIHNNGGWPNEAEYCALQDYSINFFNRLHAQLKNVSVSVNFKETNQDSRNVVSYNQYMQFMFERDYFQAIEPEEDEPVKPIGLETLLSAWKAANEVVTEQEEKLATAKKVAGDAHKAVQNALSSFGWGKPSVTITDAKDLLPGDRIRCVGESWQTRNKGQIRIVSSIGTTEAYVKAPIYTTDRDFGFEFEFVERPELA